RRNIARLGMLLQVGDEEGSGSGVRNGRGDGGERAAIRFAPFFGEHTFENAFILQAVANSATYRVNKMIVGRWRSGERGEQARNVGGSNSRRQRQRFSSAATHQRIAILNSF